MTSPSSYLFYSKENKYSLDDPEIGMWFVRVSVIDEMIQVEQLKIIHISASGDIVEELLQKEIYSLNENSKGVKYLKFQLLAEGELIDHSLENVQSLSPFPASVVVHVSQECRELVEKLILGWFNMNYISGHFAYVKRFLYFPIWHDTMFSIFMKEDNNARLNTLCQLQKAGLDVLSSLRETDSWESFAKHFFPDTVKTKNDSDTLVVYSSKIMRLAANLGRTISSFTSEEMRTLLTREDFFNYNDSQIIDFMLNQSNPTERNEIVGLLLDILRMQDVRVKMGINGFSKISYVTVKSSAVRESPYKVSLDRIPKNLSSNLIQELKNCLLEIRSNLSEKAFESTEDLTLKTEFTSILRKWFAAKVLAPKLDQSKITFAMVENRFQELFSSSFASENTCMRSYYTGYVNSTGASNEVCSIPHFCIHLAMADTSLHDDALTRLFLIVPTAAHPKDSGLYRGDSAANGFIHHTGVFIPVVGGALYLLDEILTFLEIGADVVDEQLIRLGQETTAANRKAFLMMGRERQFIESWDIQNWGVADYSRIRLLREKGISTQEEVEIFSSLPDEMFYDFLKTGESSELSI